MLALRLPKFMRLGRQRKPFVIALAVLLPILVCVFVAARNRVFENGENLSYAPQTIAIRCGKLLDGKSATPVRDAVILIQGERITAVGRDVKIPAGAQVIDLTKATVLPGLIDTHTHLTYHYDTQADETLETTAKYAAENARLTLEAGFTTVRNLGDSRGADFGSPFGGRRKRGHECADCGRANLRAQAD